MITKKDLQIINTALAQYQALIDDCCCQYNGDPECDNLACESHKKEFGNPIKTIEATRQRIFNEMFKRGVEA